MTLSFKGRGEKQLKLVFLTVPLKLRSPDHTGKLFFLNKPANPEKIVITSGL